MELAHNEQTASMVSGQLEEEGLGQRLKGAVGYLLDLGGVDWSTTYDLAAGGIVGAMADATAHATHEIGWGNFADAAYEDLKWKFEMGFAIEKGLWQGDLNILNGLTDSAITYANVAIEQKLNPSDPFAIARAVFDPIIPHYDWSKGLVVDEDPLAHEVSKILGASGVEILAGFGLDKVLSAPIRVATRVEGIAASEGARVPGELYTKLDALERLLNRWGIRLERNADSVLDKIGLLKGKRLRAQFEGFDDGTGILSLRANPTRYEVLHELSHVLDFRKNPVEWIRAASNDDLANVLRETAVFNRLRGSRSWWKLSFAEQLDSLTYVQKLRKFYDLPGGAPWVNIFK